MSLLLITAAAVITGACYFTTISEWATDAPQHALETLGVRWDHQHGL